MQLSEVLEQYLESQRVQNSKHTCFKFKNAINRLGLLLGRSPELSDLNDANIMAIEKSMSGKSPWTINTVTKKLRALWRYAAKRGWLKDWPTMSDLPQPDPYRRAWTVDEVRQILDACRRMPVPSPLWWVNWHLVQWETGERTGAMFALRWEWIARGGIDVPGCVRKAGKGCFYKLSAPTLESLAKQRTGPEPLIFSWPGCLASFYNHYERMLRKAGLPDGRKCKPQRMRRTHLTYWVLGGGNATERAKHSDCRITERHYLDESLCRVDDPEKYLPKLLQ